MNNFSHLGPHIASHATLKFFQKRFPYKSRHDYAYNDWLGLEEKYLIWYYITIALAVLYILILPISFSWLFLQSYTYAFTSIINKGEVFFPLMEPFFLLPGLLLGLYAIGFAMEATQKLLLGSRFDEFEDYYSARQEYDNQASVAWVKKIIIIPLLVSILFIVPSHVIVGKDGFSVKMFYQLLPHNYKFSEVRNATYYPYDTWRGEDQLSPHYKLFFKDNSSIDLNYHFSTLRAEQQFVGLLKTTTDTVRVDTN